MLKMTPRKRWTIWTTAGSMDERSTPNWAPWRIFTKLVAVNIKWGKGNRSTSNRFRHFDLFLVIVHVVAFATSCIWSQWVNSTVGRRMFFISLWFRSRKTWENVCINDVRRRVQVTVGQDRHRMVEIDHVNAIVVVREKNPRIKFRLMNRKTKTKRNSTINVFFLLSLYLSLSLSLFLCF